MADTTLKAVIASLPKLPQRQYDTTQQLVYLSQVAVKLGLYDADDVLKTILGKQPNYSRYSLYNNKGEEIF